MKARFFLLFTFLVFVLSNPVYAQNWTQVNIDGFGNYENGRATSMAVYNNYLYVGTENSDDEGPGIDPGAEVWQYDGTTWVQVNTDGFGDTDTETASSMAVYNNYLYVGTEIYTGAEVWQYDGTTWVQVNTDGFGNADNCIADYMAV